MDRGEEIKPESEGGGKGGETTERRRKEGRDDGEKGGDRGGKRTDGKKERIREECRRVEVEVNSVQVVHRLCETPALPVSCC